MDIDKYNYVLTRSEAIKLNNWFADQDIHPRSGWITLHKKTPTLLAKMYQVKVEDIVFAVDRVPAEEA